MAGFSNGVEVDVLNLVLRGTTYTKGPASLMSLHTADPGDTGDNEVANAGGSSYARQACAFNAAVLGAPSSCQLTATVKFSQLPAGTYPYLGLWNAAGDYIGSLPTGSTDLIQQFDALWVTTDMVFTLD